VESRLTWLAGDEEEEDSRGCSLFICKNMVAVLPPPPPGPPLSRPPDPLGGRASPFFSMSEPWVAATGGVDDVRMRLFWIAGKWGVAFGVGRRCSASEERRVDCGVVLLFMAPAVTPVVEVRLSLQ